MKYILALFVCVSTVYADVPDVTLHNKSLYPTVRIQDCNARGGSGVVVCSTKFSENEYRNVAITCHHVVCRDVRFNVRVAKYKNWSFFDGYFNCPCRIYYTNEDKDLAIILFTSDHQLPVADFGFDEKLYIGSKIFHFGCGLGDEPRLDRGEITAFKDSRYRTSMNLIFGDSGGPVYHNYKLVGIANAIRTMNYNYGQLPVNFISFVVPINDIKTIDINNALAFIYNAKHGLPNLPFEILKMEEYELLNLPIGVAW